MRTNLEVFGTTEVPQFDALVIARRLELLTEKLEGLLYHSYHIRDEAEVRQTLKDIKWHEQINLMGEEQ